MAAIPAAARTPAPGGAAAEAPPSDLAPAHRCLVFAAVGAAVAAGVALRLHARSELWLDEALTVHLAAVPLGDLADVLRRDGAPPLYYALLHGWMEVFGQGNQAVRLLSALFGVLTLPLMYRAGRRLGGGVVGIAALVLVATSPFAIRYSTEARMYSLVALLVTAGWLALVNALDQPRPRLLVAVGVISGALVLTHYWSFYLLGVTAAALVVMAWRRAERRRAALWSLAAMAIGGTVLFGPWLANFAYQAAHTGTPWGVAPGPIEVAFTTLVDLGGGPFPEGQALAGVLAALTVLALFGRALDGRHVELDLHTRPGARRELTVAGLTMCVAVAAGVLTASAFATRYTSVVFPLVILVAAFGFRALSDRRLVAIVLSLAAVLGLVGGVRSMILRRTSADSVADLIAAHGGRPGDVVAYCPDQLGPDVTRLLPHGYRQLTFPDGADPKIVNWVDYADRNRAADPAAFARRVLGLAAGRNIWYVWMPGYRTLDRQCEKVNNALGDARPGNRQLLEPDLSAFERHVLWLHPATAPEGSS